MKMASPAPHERSNCHESTCLEGPLPAAARQAAMFQTALATLSNRTSGRLCAPSRCNRSDKTGGKYWSMGVRLESLGERHMVEVQDPFECCRNHPT